MAEEHTVPIVEVAYTQGRWWSLPVETSAQLYQHYVCNRDAGHTWDWGPDGRIGSWRPNGEQTHISRYTMDFINNVQTNMDNGRRRSIRIVWVRPQDVEAQFTGELPTPQPSENLEHMSESAPDP